MSVHVAAEDERCIRLLLSNTKALPVVALMLCDCFLDVGFLALVMVFTSMASTVVLFIAALLMAVMMVAVTV